MPGFPPRFKYDLIISCHNAPSFVCALFVLIIVSYCLCLAIFGVDDDVRAASTYDTEISAFVPGHELPGKLLLTCYTTDWFSSLPFDLSYPSLRFSNCDPIICLSCSPYSFIPTSHHLLYVYLLALRVVVHA